MQQAYFGVGTRFQLDNFEAKKGDKQEVTMKL
jgi:hypothetical protein